VGKAETTTTRSIAAVSLCERSHELGTFYLYFDPGGTGGSGPAIGYLAVKKQIMLEGTTAKITASGTEQRQSWN